MDNTRVMKLIKDLSEIKGASRALEVMDFDDHNNTIEPIASSISTDLERIINDLSREHFLGC